MFAATTMLAIALQATIQTAPPPPRVYAPPAPPLPSPVITAPVRLQKDVPLIGEDDYPEQAQFDDQSGPPPLSC